MFDSPYVCVGNRLGFHNRSSVTIGWTQPINRRLHYRLGLVQIYTWKKVKRPRLLYHEVSNKEILLASSNKFVGKIDAV